VTELEDGVACFADVGDAESLAEGLARVREEDPATLAAVERGRGVAERHALELLEPLWEPILGSLASP
jgi:hypothetical protein